MMRSAVMCITGDQYTSILEVSYCFKFSQRVPSCTCLCNNLRVLNLWVIIICIYVLYDVGPCFQILWEVLSHWLGERSKTHLFINIRAILVAWLPCFFNRLLHIRDISSKASLIKAIAGSMQDCALHFSWRSNLEALKLLLKFMHWLIKILSMMRNLMVLRLFILFINKVVL